MARMPINFQNGALSPVLLDTIAMLSARLPTGLAALQQQIAVQDQIAHHGKQEDLPDERLILIVIGVFHDAGRHHEQHRERGYERPVDQRRRQTATPTREPP